MRNVRSAAMLAVAVLLAACSQSGLRNDELPLDQHLERLGYRQGETVKSIPVWETQGWEYLDKGHIVLGHAPGRRYLVAFSSPCDNLSFSNRLNIGSTVGAVTRLDRILSYDSSGIPEPCLIGELYRLERIPTRAE